MKLSAILIISGLILISIYQFIFSKTYRQSYFSYELFNTLIVLYLTILLAFALLYTLLAEESTLLISESQVEAPSFLDELWTSIYFSGVTLFTIGYGDIIPVGIARPLSLIEAMIGYLIPIAFFMKLSMYKHYVRRDQKSNDL